MVKIYFLQKMLKNGLVSEKILNNFLGGGVQDPTVENSILFLNPSLILTWQLFSIKSQRFQAWPDRRCRWVILYEFSKLWKSDFFKIPFRVSIRIFVLGFGLSSKFTIWKTTYPYHFLLLSFDFWSSVSLSCRQLSK